MDEQKNNEFDQPKVKKPFPTKILAIIASVIAVATIGAAALIISLNNKGNDDDSPTHVCSFGEWVETKTASCTETGEKVRECECGEKEIEPIQKLFHNFGNWAVVKVATCNEDGEKVRVCKTCNIEKQKNKIDKIQTHKEVTDPAVAATCTETGKTEGTHCSICNKVFLKQLTVPKISHTYDDKYDEFCNVCNFEREAECAHTETIILEGYVADCLSNGLTDGTQCKKCKEILVPQAIIYARHTPGAWLTDTEATCTVNGSKHQVCTVCNDTIRTESVAASHCLNKTIVNATPASSAKLVYDCDNCDYSSEKVIAPINVSAFLTGSGIVMGNGVTRYSRSFEVNASGGYGQYKYKFESGSNLLQDYSASNEIEVYGNVLVDLAVIKITVMDEAGQKTVYEIKGNGTYVDSYIIYD